MSHIPSPTTLAVDRVNPFGTMFSTSPYVVNTHVLAFDLIQGMQRGRTTALLDTARYRSGRIFAESP